MIPDLQLAMLIQKFYGERKRKPFLVAVIDDFCSQTASTLKAILEINGKKTALINCAQSSLLYIRRTGDILFCLGRLYSSLAKTKADVCIIQADTDLVLSGGLNGLKFHVAAVLTRQNLSPLYKKTVRLLIGQSDTVLLPSAKANFPSYTNVKTITFSAENLSGDYLVFHRKKNEFTVFGVSVSRTFVFNDNNFLSARNFATAAVCAMEIGITADAVGCAFRLLNAQMRPVNTFLPCAVLADFSCGSEIKRKIAVMRRLCKSKLIAVFAFWNSESQKALPLVDTAVFACKNIDESEIDSLLVAAKEAGTDVYIKQNISLAADLLSRLQKKGDIAAIFGFTNKDITSF